MRTTHDIRLICAAARSSPSSAWSTQIGLFGVRPIRARVSGPVPLWGDALSGQTSRRCTTMRATVRAMAGHAAYTA